MVCGLYPLGITYPSGFTFQSNFPSSKAICPCRATFEPLGNPCCTTYEPRGGLSGFQAGVSCQLGFPVHVEPGENALTQCGFSQCHNAITVAGVADPNTGIMWGPAPNPPYSQCLAAFPNTLTTLFFQYPRSLFPPSPQ